MRARCGPRQAVRQREVMAPRDPGDRDDLGEYLQPSDGALLPLSLRLAQAVREPAGLGQARGCGLVAGGEMSASPLTPPVSPVCQVGQIEAAV